jgi:polyhydroxyalkanoate synthesis repressor PhaR
VILEDIKEMILNGDTIKVVDLKTNEDVTRSILLQIILEEEVKGAPMFSDEFLYQVICFYGKALQPSLSPFLEQGVELFRKMQKRFYEQIRDAHGKDQRASGVELWKEFMHQHGPLIEEVIRDQVQTSTNVFLKMQEQIKAQTRSIFDYMQFPFNGNRES